MSEQQPSEEPTRQQIKTRTAKIVRRLGYVVFMGGGLLIFVPMLIGVGVGISNDQIWDPFTGQSVTSTERTVDCPEEARRLMLESGQMDKLNGRWNSSYSAWLADCQDDHVQLHDMLNRTRLELRDK